MLITGNSNLLVFPTFSVLWSPFWALTAIPCSVLEAQQWLKGPKDWRKTNTYNVFSQISYHIMYSALTEMKVCWIQIENFQLNQSEILYLTQWKCLSTIWKYSWYNISLMNKNHGHKNCGQTFHSRMTWLETELFTKKRPVRKIRVPIH